MRIVCVVHDDFEGVFIKDIAPPRCLEEGRRKCAQTIFDVIPADIHAIG